MNHRVVASDHHPSCCRAALRRQPLTQTRNLRKKGGNFRYISGVSGRVVRSGSLEKLPFSLVPCKGEFGRGGMQLCRQVVKTWFFTQVGPIPRSLGAGRPAALEPSYQRFEAPTTVIPLPLLAFSPPPSVMAPATKGKAKASSKKDKPPPAEPGTDAGGIKLNIRQSGRRQRGAATEDMLPPPFCVSAAWSARRAIGRRRYEQFLLRIGVVVVPFA